MILEQEVPMDFFRKTGDFFILTAKETERGLPSINPGPFILLMAYLR
jgi:hypothetical protein